MLAHRMARRFRTKTEGTAVSTMAGYIALVHKD